MVITRWLPVAGVVLWATVSPAAAQSPSLAEIARQEQERRSRVIEPTRVYTNDDLRGGPGLTTGTRPDSKPPTDAGRTDAATPPPTAEEEPERDESFWRERIESLREAQRRADLNAAALQNRVDGLWAEFTARDDPFQRAELERERDEAIAELERTKTESEELEQAILDLREEARRAAVPPGWLR